MCESNHVFGSGDKATRRQRKSNQPYFDQLEPLAPNIQTVPDSTPQQLATLKYAAALQHFNQLQEKLNNKARSAQNAHEFFEEQALLGSKEASEYLLLLAWKSIRSLEKILLKRPATITTLAASQLLWPCLVSTKPNLTRLNTLHIRKLKLGSNLGINIKARWDIETPATKHAHELLKRLQRLKVYKTIVDTLKVSNSKNAPKQIQKLAKKLGSDKKFLSDLPLEPLNKATLKRYHTLFSKMFFDRYPSPQNLKDFENVRNNNNRKSAAEKKAKVFDSVRLGVKSLLLPQ